MTYMNRCNHCGKLFASTGINEDYCPDCAEQLRREQDERCCEMERVFPDEPLDWKEFEEDIMGIDFS